MRALNAPGGSQVQDGRTRLFCNVDKDTGAGPESDLAWEATVTEGAGRYVGCLVAWHARGWGHTRSQPPLPPPPPRRTLRNSASTKQSHEQSQSRGAGRTSSAPGEHARVGGWGEVHSAPPPAHSSVPHPRLSSPHI